jgi:drug/metabolite transporter (DMT)-like permease
MKFVWNHAYLLMVLTALAWSGNAITGRGLNDIIPPIGLAFWRWVVAFPILVLIAWPHLQKDLPKIRENWFILIVLSVLSISAYNTFLYYGLLSTTAINSLLINTARPVAIVLLSLLFFGQGITLKQGCGFFLAFIGTTVIIIKADISRLASLDFNAGDIWVLAAMACWALFTVLLKKRPKMHPTSFITITVFIGALILLPFYIWETLFIKPTPFVLETVLGVFYLAIFASIVAYLFYNRAVEIAGANKAGQVSYILPILGSILAIFLLDETFQIYHAIGFMLILLGVYFGSKGEEIN